MSKKLNEQTTLIKIEQSGQLFNLSILCMLLISVLTSLILNVIAKSLGKTVTEIENSSVYIALSYAFSSLAFIVSIIAFCKKNNTKITSVFECEKPSKISVIATLLIAFGMLFGLSQVNTFVVWLVSKIGIEAPSPNMPEFSILNFTLIIVFVCFLPPIFEEIIFRNIIYKNLSKHGTIMAILLSSLVFSLYHMSISQTLYQFIVGVLFALIIYGGGSYILTAFCHFINNLFIVLNYYFFHLNFDKTTTVILTSLGIIATIVGVVLLLYKSKNYVKYQKGTAIKFLLYAFLGLMICILFWVVNLI